MGGVADGHALLDADVRVGELGSSCWIGSVVERIERADRHASLGNRIAPGPKGSVADVAQIGGVVGESPSRAVHRVEKTREVIAVRV